MKGIKRTKNKKKKKIQKIKIEKNKTISNMNSLRPVTLLTIPFQCSNVPILICILIYWQQKKDSATGN